MPATRSRRTLAVMAAVLLALISTITTPAHADELDPSVLTWRYLDNGSDPAAGLDDPDAWAGAGFDDSAWSAATGSFGALRGERAELSGGYLPDNLLSQYTDGVNNPAFFFRAAAPLSAADIAAYSQVHVDLRYDDAVSFFVNGTYVGGGDDGELVAHAERNTTYGGSNASAPKLATVTFSTDLLVPGINVFSARLNQGRANSSDVFFNLERIVLDAQGLREWSYWDLDETPSSETEAWAQPGFDDSGWKQGQGSFGSLRGEVGTISGGHNFDVLLRQYYEGTTENLETHFFRTTVSMTEADLSDDVYSHIATFLYDDGVSVFVNGTYVGGGHDEDLIERDDRDRSYGGSNHSAPNQVRLSIPTDLLNVGENVLAVRLHQGRVNSSDSYFEFVGIEPNYDSPQVLSNVVLGTGSDGSERLLAFYTEQSHSEGAVVQYARTADLIDGRFPDDATRVTPDSWAAVPFGKDVHHATLSDLEPGTSYTYRLGNAEGWLATYEFSTPAEGDFQFFYVGDAQIGSSGNLVRDSEGWANTLNVMREAFPDIALLVSGGDQVESAPNESEYLGYTEPRQLKELGHAPTVGNHDVGAPQTYAEHFNLPNYDSGTTRNHWWAQNGILFLHLNMEHRTYDNHRAWMQQILDEQGQDYDQVIVVLHRSLYSVANHSTTERSEEIRTNMAPIFHDLGIEIVLSGHDHSYARTHVMSNGEVRSEGQPSEVTLNRGELIHITANSSSGSKYYTPRDQIFDYASVINQDRVPTYAVVSAEQCSVTVDSYRATDNSLFDSIRIGTLRAVPELSVPGVTTVRADQVDDFDPLAGVTASDPCETVEAEHVSGELGAEPGTYTLGYAVEDGYGNVVTGEQVVVVTEAPVDPEPTPTATVTVTAEPSPVPTETVTVDPGPAPTQTVTTEPSPAPTVTVTAGPTGSPTSKPTSPGSRPGLPKTGS